MAVSGDKAASHNLQECPRATFVVSLSHLSLSLGYIYEVILLESANQSTTLLRHSIEFPNGGDMCLILHPIVDSDDVLADWDGVVYLASLTCTASETVRDPAFLSSTWD